MDSSKNQRITRSRAKKRQREQENEAECSRAKISKKKEKKEQASTVKQSAPHEANQGSAMALVPVGGGNQCTHNRQDMEFINNIHNQQQINVIEIEIEPELIEALASYLYVLDNLTTILEDMSDDEFHLLNERMDLIRYIEILERVEDLFDEWLL